MILERELVKTFEEFLANGYGVKIQKGTRKGELSRGMAKGRFFLIREWDLEDNSVPTVEVFCGDKPFLEELQQGFWGMVAQATEGGEDESGS